MRRRGGHWDSSFKLRKIAESHRITDRPISFVPIIFVSFRVFKEKLEKLSRALEELPPHAALCPIASRKGQFLPGDRFNHGAVDQHGKGPSLQGSRKPQRQVESLLRPPAAAIPTRAAPGDYLPPDTDQDGDLHHSAMFLAYDTSQSPVVIWTLEGNHGNKVSVVQREFDHSAFRAVNTGIATLLVANNPVFRGLGYILSSMLCNL
jgi:hypothetical protein